ncbi:MAG: hypothetical protein ACREJD_08390 [Phycisphaerales bacterium]
MTTNNTVSSKAPTHAAYHVREGKDKKGFFTRIGAAWPHKDGNGFNVQLEGLVPLDGRLTLRVITEKRD